jgi:hypothetical protein
MYCLYVVGYQVGAELTTHLGATVFDSDLILRADVLGCSTDIRRENRLTLQNLIINLVIDPKRDK